jgi:2-hydroxychromene-2-carboxylate isomerase
VAPPTIDFWFSIGSTYTYLTVMRIGALAKTEGVEIVWRPFSVRTLMIEQNNIPFRDKPIKTAYMRRDIARRGERYGLAVTGSVPYPLSQWDMVNTTAVLAAEEGWIEPLAIEIYRRWFQLGQEPGVAPHWSEALVAIGRDPAEIAARVATPEAESRYHAATDAARERGLFGSPSFLVGDELFWGDDRLEDAIAWAKRGTLAGS